MKNFWVYIHFERYFKEKDLYPVLSIDRHLVLCPDKDNMLRWIDIAYCEFRSFDEPIATTTLEWKKLKGK